MVSVETGQAPAHPILLPLWASEPAGGQGLDGEDDEEEYELEEPSEEDDELDDEEEIEDWSDEDE
jgi:hypothetical protein